MTNVSRTSSVQQTPTTNLSLDCNICTEPYTSSGDHRPMGFMNCVHKICYLCSQNLPQPIRCTDCRKTGNVIEDSSMQAAVRIIEQMKGIQPAGSSAPSAASSPARTPSQSQNAVEDPLRIIEDAFGSDMSTPDLARLVIQHRVRLGEATYRALSDAIEERGNQRAAQRSASAVQDPERFLNEMNQFIGERWAALGISSNQRAAQSLASAVQGAPGLLSSSNNQHLSSHSLSSRSLQRIPAFSSMNSSPASSAPSSRPAAVSQNRQQTGSADPFLALLREVPRSYDQDTEMTDARPPSPFESKANRQSAASAASSSLSSSRQPSLLSSLSSLSLSAPSAPTAVSAVHSASSSSDPFVALLKTIPSFDERIVKDDARLEANDARFDEHLKQLRRIQDEIKRLRQGKQLNEGRYASALQSMSGSALHSLLELSYLRYEIESTGTFVKARSPNYEQNIAYTLQDQHQLFGTALQVAPSAPNSSSIRSSSAPTAVSSLQSASSSSDPFAALLKTIPPFEERIVLFYGKETIRDPITGQEVESTARYDAHKKRLEQIQGEVLRLRQAGRLDEAALGGILDSMKSGSLGSLFALSFLRQEIESTGAYVKKPLAGYEMGIAYRLQDRYQLFGPSPQPAAAAPSSNSSRPGTASASSSRLSSLSSATPSARSLSVAASNAAYDALRQNDDTSSRLTGQLSTLRRNNAPQEQRQAVQTELDRLSQERQNLRDVMYYRAPASTPSNQQTSSEISSSPAANVASSLSSNASASTPSRAPSAASRRPGTTAPRPMTAAQQREADNRRFSRTTATQRGGRTAGVVNRSVPSASAAKPAEKKAEKK